jgi:hypothetical protein
MSTMKSKTEMIDHINENLPDNTSRAITPSVLRDSLINMLGTGSAAVLSGGPDFLNRISASLS